MLKSEYLQLLIGLVSDFTFIDFIKSCYAIYHGVALTSVWLEVMII